MTLTLAATDIRIPKVKGKRRGGILQEKKRADLTKNTSLYTI